MFHPLKPNCENNNMAKFFFAFGQQGKLFPPEWYKFSLLTLRKKAECNSQIAKLLL